VSTPDAPAPHEHVVFTDLGDAEGVLVDLHTKQYFQLNATACDVWRGLAHGTPIGEIARGLTVAYDVTPEHARSSVDKAIAKFAALRLLTAR
jgi:hypothetical protein